jgi:hypothetical protein
MHKKFSEVFRCIQHLVVDNWTESTGNPDNYLLREGKRNNQMKITCR